MFAMGNVEFVKLFAPCCMLAASHSLAMERRTEASQDVQAAARHPRILGYGCQCSGHSVYNNKMVQMSYLATFARACPCVEFRDSGLSVRSFGLSVLFRPWSSEIWGTTVPLAWPLRATRPTAPTTSMVAPPHSAFFFFFQLFFCTTLAHEKICRFGMIFSMQGLSLLLA